MKLHILCPPNTKFFLGKGALPLTTPTRGPAPGPLRTPRSQTVLPTIQNGMTRMHKHSQSLKREGRSPHFWWQSGEMSHSRTRGNLKLVEAWNLWRKWYKLRIHYEIIVNFTLGNGFHGLFKTPKPMSCWVLRPLTPSATMESLMKYTNWQSVWIYMWILPPILPSKTVFLGLINAKTNELFGAEPLAPGVWNLRHWSPVKMVQIENSLITK